MSRTRVVALLRMELRLLLRNGENLLVTLGIPVGLLAFFSSVEVLPTQGRAVDFLLPGMLAVAVMGSAMVSLAIATGFERSYLVLKRLGATPLRRTELIAAKLLATLAILIVQVAVLAGVALLLGWRVQPANALRATSLAAIGLVLGACAFAGLGLAMAGRLRALTTLAVVNALFVVLLLTSGLLFPLDVLPPAAATAAGLLPSAALGQVLRAAFSGSGQLLGALVVLGAWAVAMPALAASVFRWE